MGYGLKTRSNRLQLQWTFIKNSSQMKNLELSMLPTVEEVRTVLVFELSGESASGPDGFTSLFYQTCWDVIGADIHNMVLHFYGGAALPKSITHTNLVLLPKKPRVETFSDLRPISLNNFINKDRSIFESILLTQEIITNIRLRRKPANVVIKLDMAKAYDRVSWKYLLHSTRSVKQGDPLSPALFILSAEVHSRSLNKLFEDRTFVGFGMPKWFDPLNHLTYVDDTIIFASAHPPSLSKIMAVRAITEFAKGKFPFTYLGCPIFYTRRRKEYYEDLINHASTKKCPGASHKIFAIFIWSTKEEGRSRHWASWQNLCLPKEEGGLGFRSLHDVSRALFAKLWWRFRTTKSLWSNFMWNKYCKKEIPTVVQFRRGSNVWRKMMNDREEVEHEILWELKSGTTNIWHENWIGLGALYHVLPQDFPINEDLQDVAELR
ncbi:uncharacterized protein [Nicotiana sylvestris]|uniref:uncharacterized protein n=1 Tax=Nicotiana sylvestris TaxID=4096 RepID=UPI00388C889C